MDANALRARWPEVLAAVQRERRVAWMQLSNATVESLADGVLTLAFAQAGVARGFLTGGYDKDLGAALSALFGITPKIATTLGPPGRHQAGPGRSGGSAASARRRPPAAGRRPRRGRKHAGTAAAVKPRAARIRQASRRLRRKRTPIPPTRRPRRA